MKRSDITTRTILHAVATAGVNAWEVLTADRPTKVVLAAIQREVDADHLEYGVSLTRPFLTPKGRAKLAESTVDPNGRQRVMWRMVLPEDDLTRAIDELLGTS